MHIVEYQFHFVLSLLVPRQCIAYHFVWKNADWQRKLTENILKVIFLFKFLGDLSVLKETKFYFWTTKRKFNIRIQNSFMVHDNFEFSY
jgi:hypothetical protein